MIDEEELVARVIAASAGSEVVGRVRLQKVFYLLDQLGLNSRFTYSYHHYGPFSADLAEAVEGAKAFSYVVERSRHRRDDGVPFGVFALGSAAPTDVAEEVGSLRREQVEHLLSLMNGRSSTVLEVAATIHWLRDVLELPNWRQELLARKGKKAEAGRTEEALQLLVELGL